MKDFAYIVMFLLVIGGTAYGILNILDLANIIAGPFSPNTIWLGLSVVTIIPWHLDFCKRINWSNAFISVRQ